MKNIISPMDYDWLFLKTFEVRNQIIDVIIIIAARI